MLKRTMLAALMAVFSMSVWAADAQQIQAKEQVKEQTREQSKTQANEQIYGSQLMTPEERQAHQMKMRSAKTQEERERVRLEHHKQMQERAKVKGVTLPDEPPARGGGMGPGGGMGGGGMGPGGGGR